MWLIIVGFVVHIIFFGSVFDIYFKSPVIHGMTPHASPLSPPAKRLVLFVADGLRADIFFERPDSAPYLRSVLTERGSWGVSHTRVPTETRPGHVALIAGLYEDPSAIARGWKENPVEFDSVFNQSHETWSWGSPDILPMFAKGASGNHVWMEMYNPEEEDFSGKLNTTRLDLWVFDKVKKFLNEAKENVLLYEKLHKHKIVLFLHLLGLDTAGHTHKPYSVEYEENIHVVDNGVKDIEQLIEEFFDYDNMTAYVFTSDHGMTDWGSHGAGDISETDTPLVVWGAGVSGPKPALPRRAPHSPSTWGLGHLARRDVRQADITPLMATLIGIPVPVNSVGIIPKEYLDIPEQLLAEAIFANARQIAAQYSKKKEMTEAGTVVWLYRPFLGLAEEKESSIIDEIHSNIYGGRYRDAIALSEVLMNTCLAGLQYYETYYQCLMLTCITLAFLGWITWLFWALLIGQSSGIYFEVFRGGILLNLIFMTLSCITGYLIWIQDLPPQMYVYCLLPEFLWWGIAREHYILLKSVRRLKDCVGLRKPILLGCVYALGIETLVLSFFYRQALSFALFGVALWPLMEHRHHLPKLVLAAWFASCFAIAIFPALPVVGKGANSNLVQLSGLLWVLFMAITIICSNVHLESRALRIIFIQIFLLLIVVWNIYIIESNLKDKQGLLLFNQILSWILFGTSMFLPLMGTKKMLFRLLTIAFSLTVPFLLLSASHEGFFLLTLTLHMLCWLLLESSIIDSSIAVSDLTFEVSSNDCGTKGSVSTNDFRRSYFFLLYVILSFFGTGNIASINSFDPTWVRCFVTVFSPFLMTILILWKTVIPFLIVTCFFRAQNIMIQVPAEKLFLIVLILCDLMGVHFLHMVTNQGSWLDIGTSISHYVIMESTTLFILLLYSLAKVYTDFLWPPSSTEVQKNTGKEYKSLEAGNTRSGNFLLDTCYSFRGHNSTFRKRHFE